MNLKRAFTRFSAIDSDVDGLREHHAQTMKPTKIDPLDGSRTISVDDLHFSIGDFDVWAGKCKSGMNITFRDVVEGYALYLPRQGSTEFVFDGEIFESSPGTIFVCDFTQLRSLRVFPGRSHIGIAFSKNAVIRQLSELIDAPVLEEIDFTKMVDVGSGIGARLTSMSELLWRLLEENPEVAVASRANELFLHTLMVSLLEGVPHRYSNKMQGKRSAAVPRHVKRAIEFMVAEIGRSLTVEEIATACGVTSRTLQLGFQEFKDTTPLAYLRQLRFNGVRRDLAKRNDHELIAVIARRWGFTHMGRFASLYKEVFGESPSETLRSRSGIIANIEIHTSRSGLWR